MGFFFTQGKGTHEVVTKVSAPLPRCLCFLLVSNAIQFLASVCERPHYKNLFEDQNTLTSICEKVIVPNMEFRGNYGKVERVFRGVKVVV